MIKEFDKLCTQIFYYKNKFQFPFDAIIHEEGFQDILKSEDYPILESKMKNLLVLLNENPLLVEEDTENLWDKI